MLKTQCEIARVNEPLSGVLFQSVGAVKLQKSLGKFGTGEPQTREVLLKGKAQYG